MEKCPVTTLALLVQSKPYENRASRANIDLALAAAAMDFSLHIYFSGPAILQLSAQYNCEAAMLPPGYRAWAALPELTKTAIYGEKSWLEYCQLMNTKLILPATALSASDMRNNWRLHDHVLAI
jgi:sulfur relay (sulfurtransferase) DsrF/TusC family protein